ncbi:N-acetylated-alpha-linked acidic dipeptidase-like protein [Geopyxis carbonaria]|nr:N-acetylated-alpha-linked acidic dipeptidase-like protein [Geopyxis carbonaria]
MAPRDERQPLLATVPISPSHRRYPNSRILTRILTTIFVSTLCYLFLALFFFPTWPPSTPLRLFSNTGVGRLPIETLENILFVTPSTEKAREWSQYYTSGPHLGGKNFSQALWTKERWEEMGIPEVEIETYDIYTNYPKGHRLGLLKKIEYSDHNAPRLDQNLEYELLFEASLEEPVLEEDPTTALEDRIPTFHGFSANGNTTAEYVFANYGTFQDFEDLLSHGINITGKVVLCKYGHIFRGLKVKRAQDLGATGVLIYSDPGDDGDITELNGYEAYPNGPARHPDSVQRGSVQFLSYGPGDPTTPGYASKPGVPRQDPSKLTPSIPSLPLSYMDALPLLRALNGHGLNPGDLGDSWKSGGLHHKGVDYSTGPAPGIVVNLVNEVENVITPQWNVIGRIPGHISDELIILGNHRDAWIAGGAGDPSSGSAALLEMVRSFGSMLAAGWKPTRTIMLASWDGEEYGLLGSTEWVEDHALKLGKNSLAYINVDVGARSHKFAVAANPLLENVLVEAVKKVMDPDSVINGSDSTSVFDVWDKKIKILGSGSDYTAFQDFVGIPSIDMGFSALSKDDPVYHYHSNYDSFHWMEKFGDPTFDYHVAMTKIWGLIALNLSESPVVQFNVTKYATDLGRYLEAVSNMLDADYHQPLTDTHKFRHAMEHLSHAIKRLSQRAAEFDKHASHISDALSSPNTPWYRKTLLLFKARRINTKYKLFDRAFLYHKGLDERSWFKHVVFAPGKWTGYSGDSLPGLVETVRIGDWHGALRWVKIVGRAVHRAHGVLN